VWTREMMRADKLMYVMRNVAELPQELLRDLGTVECMSLVWSPPLEINLWMGTPTVSTPAHFGACPHSLNLS